MVYFKANNDSTFALIVLIIMLMIIGGTVFLVVWIVKKITNAIKNKNIVYINAEETSAKDTRECPFCAEIIKKKAALCRFCGKEVQPIE
jgi:cell division protein FtsX